MSSVPNSPSPSEYDVHYTYYTTPHDVTDESNDLINNNELLPLLPGTDDENTPKEGNGQQGDQNDQDDEIELLHSPPPGPSTTDTPYAGVSSGEFQLHDGHHYDEGHDHLSGGGGGAMRGSGVDAFHHHVHLHLREMQLQQQQQQELYPYHQNAGREHPSSSALKYHQRFQPSFATDLDGAATPPLDAVPPHRPPPSCELPPPSALTPFVPSSSIQTARSSAADRLIAYTNTQLMMLHGAVRHQEEEEQKEQVDEAENHELQNTNEKRRTSSYDTLVPPETRSLLDPPKSLTLATKTTAESNGSTTIPSSSRQQRPFFSSSNNDMSSFTAALHVAYAETLPSSLPSLVPATMSQVEDRGEMEITQHQHYHQAEAAAPLLLHLAKNTTNQSKNDKHRGSVSSLDCPIPEPATAPQSYVSPLTTTKRAIPPQHGAAVIVDGVTLLLHHPPHLNLNLLAEVSNSTTGDAAPAGLGLPSQATTVEEDVRPISSSAAPHHHEHHLISINANPHAAAADATSSFSPFFGNAAPPYFQDSNGKNTGGEATALGMRRLRDRAVMLSVGKDSSGLCKVLELKVNNNNSTNNNDEDHSNIPICCVSGDQQALHANGSFASNTSEVSSAPSSRAPHPPPPTTPLSSIQHDRHQCQHQQGLLWANPAVTAKDNYFVAYKKTNERAGTGTGINVENVSTNTSFSSSRGAGPEITIVEINGKKVHVVNAPPPKFKLPSPAAKNKKVVLNGKELNTMEGDEGGDAVVEDTHSPTSLLPPANTTTSTSGSSNDKPKILVQNESKNSEDDGDNNNNGPNALPSNGDNNERDDDDEDFKIPTWLFYLACGVLMTDAVGTSMLYSYVGLLVAHVEPSLTASSSGYVAGILVGAFQAAQVITMPLWGRASDIVGRKPVMLTALVLSVTASMLFGLSSSFLQLLFVRVIHGTVCAGISVGKTYIFEVTTPKSQAKGFGYMNLSWSLGSFIGPSIGGFLYDINSSPIFSKILPHMGLFDTFPALGPAIALSSYGFLIALLSYWYLPESRPDCVPVGTAMAWVGEWLAGKLSYLCCCCGLLAPSSSLVEKKIYVDAATSPIAFKEEEDNYDQQIAYTNGNKINHSSTAKNTTHYLTLAEAPKKSALPSASVSPNLNPTVIYSMRKGALHTPSSTPPLRPRASSASGVHASNSTHAVVEIRRDNPTSHQEVTKIASRSKKGSPATSEPITDGAAILYVESPRTCHVLDEVPIAIFTPQHVPMQIMYCNDEEVEKEQQKLEDLEDNKDDTEVAVSRDVDKNDHSIMKDRQRHVQESPKDDDDPYLGKPYANFHRRVDAANDFLNTVPLISTKQILTHPLLRYTIPMGMLIACVNVTYNEIWPLYAIAARENGGMGMTSTHIGIAGMMNAVIALLINGIFDKLCKRFKHMTLWSVCNMGIAVAMVLLGCFHYLPSPTVALVCFVPLCLLRTPCSAVLFGLSMMFNANASPKKHIGMVNSIAQSGQALARSITPMLAAPLFAWSVTGGFSESSSHGEGDAVPKEKEGGEVHMFPFNHFLVFLCCTTVALLTYILGKKIPNAVITVRRR